MSNLHRPDSEAWHESAIDVAASYNESALEELAWAIEASVGQFKLFLARCNYTSLRSQLVERLRELMSVEIRILELKASEKTLYARIQAELDSEQPDALMVFGLESVGDLDELLSATNQVREEFRKNFHFPVVLWVSDEVLKKLLQLAPDFESWAITTEFVVATDELIDFVRQIAQKLFDGDLKLRLGAFREIKLACHDLHSRKQVLDLELKAGIEYLLGFTESDNLVNRNLDKALEHYQKGLELWQQSNNLERQGQVLSDIAFCYYLKALRHRKIDHPDWQATRHYLRQSLEVFEQAQRPDLVANSILGFGKILRRLQDWEQLQTLVQKALQRHQTENKPIELAQDYGFLAEVALAKKRWSEAKDLAQKALEVLSAVPSLQSANSSGVVYKLPDKPVISYEPSRYRFILGQAQQHLDQPQEAIRNLEAAKRVGSPEHDTQLYLDILWHLQKLYFEQKEYLKAFEIKLERQSIEQQYGFRAFVGAGRIQPQRQAKFALTPVKSQETIAPEITASGRQLDVERLVQRIGEPSYKLIVIHGQSGVGKSSLVNGGLVPALKQKVIGTSDVLPVPMRVYTSWVGELGKLLAEALLEKGIDLPTPLDSEAAILEQLQQSESRNLRTVLIFDQFEEFFFVYPTPGERRQFFEFVGACLKILPVKVILSLREDYLHYLLECDRLPSMKMIGNDILTKNVRYRLGNFSVQDAKAIVQRLTEQTYFHLEPDLIEQLVRDLAGNEGEVRPIELQIVGAQLQTESITKLAEYQARGQKEELVKRYLAEVVSDCGAENKQVAELVLFLLTDEKGTRPLKTRAELERDLQAISSAYLTLEANQLDLVFKIFVDSGLVVLLPELPADRYQLVHDYLAAFIRQQQDNELLAKLKQSEEQQKRTQAELNQVLKGQVRVTLTALGTTIGGLVAAGLAGWLAFRTGHKAVTDLASRLSRETAVRIEQRLLIFADVPHLFLEMNAVAIRTGNLNVEVEDFPKFERYLWHQIQLRKEVHTLYYGDEEGNFILLKKGKPDLVYIRDPSTALRKIYRVDGQGNRTDLVKTDQYDPRTRPWYKAAVQTGKPSWSPIYLSVAQGDLGITPVLPIYKESGEVRGVLASDLTFPQISDFLRSIKITPSGQAFIIERSGEIVASSTAELPSVMTKEGIERRNANQSNNVLIKAAAEHLQQRFGDFSTIDHNQQLMFDLKGQRQLVQVTLLQDKRGLDWLLVVVIPESDLLGDIYRNTIVTLCLCLTITGLAVLLGFVAARRISRNKYG